MSLAKEARWTKLEWGALLLVAIVHVIALRDFETTAWSRHPMVDAYVYWDQAKQLIAGGAPFEEGLYQPPGYPLFLWLVSTVVGEASLHAVRVCQLLLGLGTCTGILVLARRICSGRGWPGALAVLIYGLLPSTVLFAHDLLTPTLTNACLVGALVLLWKDTASTPLSAVRLGLAGMLLGAACIVHPTYLLAVFVLLAWAWSAKQVAPTGLMALVLGVVLVLGPQGVGPPPPRPDGQRAERPGEGPARKLEVGTSPSRVVVATAPAWSSSRGAGDRCGSAVKHHSVTAWLW